MMRNLFVVLFVAIASFATAQEKKCDKPGPEKFLEFRVNHMQQRLMLDDAKAAEFAKIYKEYLQEKMACRPTMARGKALTDAEIKSNIEARMDAEQKVLDVEKKYYKKLAKVLNAKQLQVIFCKKDDFGKDCKKNMAPRGMKKDNGFAPRGMKKGPRFAPETKCGKRVECKK